MEKLIPIMLAVIAVAYSEVKNRRWAKNNPNEVDRQDYKHT